MTTTYGKRLGFVSEADVSRHDRRWAIEWNTRLAAAERKLGDGLVWHQRASDFGELVAASTGAHVVYGADPVEALEAVARMA